MAVRLAGAFHCLVVRSVPPASGSLSSEYLSVALSGPDEVCEMACYFTVAVRSGASQMPLVVAASGPRLVTAPPLRPGQHLVGHRR
jgi:hypothetical protein